MMQKSCRLVWALAGRWQQVGERVIRWYIWGGAALIFLHQHGSIRQLNEGPKQCVDG
jgi:hypothetical protein